MKKSEILSRIDHTELRANATVEDFQRLSEEAQEFGVPAVCVPPNRVEQMRKWLPSEINVATVVGFPFGYNTTETKAWETKQAILMGADEIDMVIDIGTAIYASVLSQKLSGGYTDKVKSEIAQIRQICTGGIILKVIVETCYLNLAQKINLCNMLIDLGVDYIKTSTGFGPKGATVDDVKLFRDYLQGAVKIKAAGGISTIEAARQMVLAGCDRIGSSKLVRLLAQVEGDEV